MLQAWGQPLDGGKSTHGHRAPAGPQEHEHQVVTHHQPSLPLGMAQVSPGKWICQPSTKFMGAQPRVRPSTSCQGAHSPSTGIRLDCGMAFGGLVEEPVKLRWGPLGSLSPWRGKTAESTFPPCVPKATRIFCRKSAFPEAIELCS